MEQSSAVVGSAGLTDGMDTEATAEEAFAGSPQVAHSLMDVLRPATPPQPKNARIIRRFDLEAAKYDPQPQSESQSQSQSQGEAPMAEAKPAPQPSRSREEAKALRNRSLAAAAGFV